MTMRVLVERLVQLQQQEQHIREQILKQQQWIARAIEQKGGYAHADGDPVRAILGEYLVTVKRPGLSAVVQVEHLPTYTDDEEIAPEIART